MNTYACTYRGKSIEIDAVNQHSAQAEAALFFRARRHSDVSTVLIVKVGKQASRKG